MVGFCMGMQLYAQEKSGPGGLLISLDPAIVDVAFPLIGRLMCVVNGSGMADISITFDFVERVVAVERHHTLTGKLSGAGVRLSGEGDLWFNSLNFSVAHYSSIRGIQGRASLTVRTKLPSIAPGEVRDLLELLFEREVLCFLEER